MKNGHTKKNIALIIPGGIGTGRTSIGIPVLERIIKLLALEFDITVFQLFPVNDGYSIQGFEVIPVYSTYPVLKIIKFFYVFIQSNRQKQFKAVHGFWVMPSGFLAVLMGKVYKIKSIVSVLGGDAIALPEIHYGQLRNPLYKKFILWTLRHAHEVNALTEYLINNLEKAGLRRKDIKTIPWGIDTELFTYQERPLEETVQFLHVANLHPVKDQVTLLRTFKIISDKLPAHLTIIGEGDLRENVILLIEELHLKKNVTILGLIPYEQLSGFYHQADILLHTSLSEGQSEVVTEAMSCGVLVCGTNVGLIHDLPECCIAVPVKDYKLLASECIRLIGDPKRIKMLRDQAHRWTAEHTIAWTTERIKELYRC